MNYTWIPYYQEFAEKLLSFRNDRKALLKLIYDRREELLAGYLHDEDSENILDTGVKVIFLITHQRVCGDF